jgi:intein-encoded DNA endonuclease-like protein
MSLHKLSLDKRIKLYGEAQRLSKSGLSPRAIERRLRSTYGYSVAATNINKWVYHGARPDTRANIPNLNPSPHLSYFLGAYKGDGYQYCDSRNRIFRVGFRVKDRDFAKHASRAIAAVLRRGPVPLWTARGRGGPNDTFHVFSVGSWSLRSFLRRNLEVQLAVAMKFPREFLRGIFDAEGFVSVGRCGNRIQVYVGIAMSDRRIIEAIRRILLVEFGIATSGPYQKKGRPSMIQGHVAMFRRTTYEIRVSTHASVEKFAQVVGFSIRRKNRKLAGVLKLLRASDSRTALTIWEKRHRRKAVSNAS